MSRNDDGSPRPHNSSSSAKCTLSNEAMFRRTWATFVDGAISKHQQHEASGCESSVGGGGRIELRDVMVLEEVLARIEDAVGGGRLIDHEGRTSATAVGLARDDSTESESISAVGNPSNESPLKRNDRTSLQTISGLPPMFENPRPSFFAAMYKYGPPPPTLDVKASHLSTTDNDSRSTRPRNALDPGRCSSTSPTTAGIQEGEERNFPRGDSQDGRETAGADAAFTPASDAVAPEGADGRVTDDPETSYLRKCSVASGGMNSSSSISSRGAVVAGPQGEDGRHCSEPRSVGSEVDVAQPISPELLPQLMESLYLGGRSRTPSPVACNPLKPQPSRHSSHGAVHHHAAGETEKQEVLKGKRTQPALSSSDARSDILPAAAAAVTAFEVQQHAVTPQSQARLIQQSSEDEEEASFHSPEQGGQAQRPREPHVDDLPQTDPFPEDVVLSRLSAQFDATHIEEAGDEVTRSALRGQDGYLFSSKSEEMAGALEITVSKTSTCYHNHNGGGVVTDEEERLPCALFREHSGTMVGVTVPEYDDDDGSSSPEDPPRETRGQEDGCSRIRVDAESPELVRAGSACQTADENRHHDPWFDDECSGEGAAASRTCGSGDDSNDAAAFSPAQSPDGALVAGEEGGSQVFFGSTPSLDIGGFGRFDGCDDCVHALSPLALARSFDDCGDAGGGDDACGDEGGCGGGGGGGGGGWGLSPDGVGDDCCGGLSPVRSASSESTDDPDGGEPPLSCRARRALFVNEKGGLEEDDEDITLTPEVSRSSRRNGCPSPFPRSTGGSMEETKEGKDSERRDLEPSAASIEEGGSGMMPPPPPRQPSLARQRKKQRQPEEPIDTLRGSVALGDVTNTSARRYSSGRSGGERSLSCQAGAKYHGGGGGGGSGGHEDQVSIGSFSESEKDSSRLGGSVWEGGGGEDNENTDGSSLAEGTPRRGRISPEDNAGGFYPPLQVSNIAKKGPKGLSLSTLQRSTLQWMIWREGGEKAGGEAGRGAERSDRSTAASAAASPGSDSAARASVRGGVLGHLRPDEAWTCVRALVRGDVASGGDPAGGKADRVRPVHGVTRLPCGATLIIAPTKKAAWQWSDRLESGVDGLSVLSYVMPLRERRRLSAKQVAAFDVVVTSYDVVKAKEVPREVKSKKTTSPRSWALPGSREWRAKHTKEEEGGRKTRPVASKTEHMVSLLHGVWWDRVVADGAQLLANQRSSRAAAALSLVGTARWCVVGRESMAVVENASERMRCLTAFLRVPAGVPMVEVAESLFYRSRPNHIAPLHPRSCFGGADNSLSLSEGGESQSSPGSSRRQRRPALGRRKSGNRGPGAGVQPTAGRKGEPVEGGMEFGSPAMQRNGRNGRGGWRSPPVLEERRSGRSRGTEASRATREGEGEPPEKGKTEPGGQGREGIGGGGGAVTAGREVLTRGDVTYAATTLRLRRARGEAGPIEVGHNR